MSKEKPFSCNYKQKGLMTLCLWDYTPLLVPTLLLLEYWVKFSFSPIIFKALHGTGSNYLRNCFSPAVVTDSPDSYVSQEL